MNEGYEKGLEEKTIVDSDSERVSIAMEVLADTRRIFKNKFPQFRDNVIVVFQKGEKRQNKKNVVFLGEAMTRREAYEDYATQIFDILIRARRKEDSESNKNKSKKSNKPEKKKDSGWLWRRKGKRKDEGKVSDDDIRQQEEKGQEEKKQEGNKENNMREELVNIYMNLIYHDFSPQAGEEQC